MKFREIGELLDRSERTIWINYRNSKLKKKDKIKVSDKKGEGLSIPIEIFANRKLSVLESVVLYLREKGLRNSEVSKRLDKDPRNIWTIYNRAKKKIGSN